jgi:nucleoside-diphosphate-sugar epimerase
VLITGGTGFVGLNVVEALLARGDDVVTVSDADMPAYAARVFGSLPGRLARTRADVSDAAAVAALMTAHRPDAVVHAAVITAGEAREFTEFGHIIDVNVTGTGYVLAAALAHGVRRMIYVSSGSAYGAALLAADIVDEDTPPQPDTLYAITKHAAERVCARFRDRRGLDVVCARLGSVFGPWERDTGVRDTLSLPFQIYRRAAAGEEVVLGRREARRDWVYASDVAAGIIALIDAPALRHALYALSSGGRWSGFAARWCETLRNTMPGFRWRTAGEGEAANVSFLGDSDRALMAIDRIASETGFRPRFRSADVCSEYAAWLVAHKAYYE